VLGLIGVLVVLRPGIASFNPAAFLVLAAAFGYAITMITPKQLTMTETTFGIVFWMAVIQLPLSLLGSDPAALLGVIRRTARHVRAARRLDHRCRRVVESARRDRPAALSARLASP
jgi:S-adenosylmethionine uptake transporter